MYTPGRRASERSELARRPGVYIAEIILNAFRFIHKNVFSAGDTLLLQGMVDCRVHSFAAYKTLSAHLQVRLHSLPVDEASVRPL